MFLGSLERYFHGLFKTHLIFYFSHLLRAPETIKVKKQFFGGTASGTVIRAPNNLKAYFNKWTTFGEPPVGSGSLSDFYFGSNKLLLLDL